MLLGDSCYRSLVHNLTISDSVCMKLAVSKALSLAIVAASSVVKVPQMIKLINSGSAEGVSFIGYLLETASLMVTLVYNVRNKFPFSSFGETAFIVVQNVAICFLVLEYSGKGNMGTMLIAALAGAGFLLFNSDIVSAELLQYLQMGAGAVAALSKLPQIIAIFREGGTGLCFHRKSYRPIFSCRFSNRAQANDPFPNAGLLLPLRLPLAHLHHPARSPRQSHPLQLHRRLRAQRRPRPADGALLEGSSQQEDDRAQAYACCSARHQRVRGKCGRDGQGASDGS
jgi:uncharacterized protein with PQ loop repeat